MKRNTLPGLLAAAVLLVAQAAPAADSELRIEPYLWAAGLTGTIGAPGSGPGLPVGGQIDATFGDLLGNMKIAGGFMVSADYRRDRWSVFGDWTYAHITSEAPSPLGPLFSGVEGDLKGHIVQGAAGYQVYGARGARVDVFGGVRYYNLNLRLDLQAGLLSARTLEVSPDWADGIVGVRYQALLGEHWVPGVQVDVGMGGSNYSWQGIASLGYRVSWGEISGGWRSLKVDYKSGDTTVDLALSGPFLGAVFRF
jgi:hypothetical protein